MDNSEQKNKHLKYFVVFLLMMIVIFAVFPAIFKYANKNNSAKNSNVDLPSQKSDQNIIDSLTVPVSREEQKTPPSEDIIDSLAASISKEKQKIPISKNVINSLTAPAKNNL